MQSCISRHTRLARYLCAAFTADRMDISLATALKRVPKQPSEFWHIAARAISGDVEICLAKMLPAQPTEPASTLIQ